MAYELGVRYHFDTLYVIDWEDVEESSQQVRRSVTRGAQGGKYFT